jgi:hypothetical protein
MRAVARSGREASHAIETFTTFLDRNANRDMALDVKKSHLQTDTVKAEV